MRADFDFNLSRLFEKKELRLDPTFQKGFPTQKRIALADNVLNVKMTRKNKTMTISHSLFLFLELLKLFLWG
jgi:hypothetical protein